MSEKNENLHPGDFDAEGNFVRAMAKPMPDDWYKIGSNYSEEWIELRQSEGYLSSLTDPCAPKLTKDDTLVNEVFLLPTLGETLSFFETAISKSEFRMIYFDPEYDVLEEDGEVTTRERPVPPPWAERINFARAWAKRHTDYPIYVWDNISRRLHGSIVDAAIFFVAGRHDISCAYREVIECYQYRLVSLEGRKYKIGNTL